MSDTLHAIARQAMPGHGIGYEARWATGLWTPEAARLGVPAETVRKATHAEAAAVDAARATLTRVFEWFPDCEGGTSIDRGEVAGVVVYIVSSWQWNPAEGKHTDRRDGYCVRTGSSAALLAEVGAAAVLLNSVGLL